MGDGALPPGTPSYTPVGRRPSLMATPSLRALTRTPAVPVPAAPPPAGLPSALVVDRMGNNLPYYCMDGVRFRLVTQDVVNQDAQRDPNTFTPHTGFTPTSAIPDGTGMNDLGAI